MNHLIFIKGDNRLIRGYNILVFGIFFLLFSCTQMCSTSRKDFTPEEIVEKYLTTSLGMVNIEEKKVLLSLTTGNLKKAISDAPDDLIRSAFINREYDVKTFSILERRDRTPRETEITFILSYQNPKEGINSSELPTLSTENTVALTKEKGAWWIRDVVGKKTSIDFPVSSENIIKPNQ